MPTRTLMGISEAFYIPAALAIRILDFHRISCPGAQRLEGRGVTPDITTPAPTLADLRAGLDRDLDAALQVFP